MKIESLALGNSKDVRIEGVKVCPTHKFPYVRIGDALKLIINTGVSFGNECMIVAADAVVFGSTKDGVLVDIKNKGLVIPWEYFPEGLRVLLPISTS